MRARARVLGTFELDNDNDVAFENEILENEFTRDL